MAQTRRSYLPILFAVHSDPSSDAVVTRAGHRLPEGAWQSEVLFLSLIKVDMVAPITWEEASTSIGKLHSVETSAAEIL
jgi:hypothetical protein